MSARRLPPYEACERLFGDYPQAASGDAMTLIVPGSGPRFYSLSRAEEQLFALFEWKPGDGSLEEVTPGTRSLPGEFGGPTPKVGGRELDGRTWDQMPALAG